MKKRLGWWALAVCPTVAWAQGETVEGAQADLVSRVAAMTAFQAAEDCYTRSVLARTVAVAKDRGFELSRVNAMAGGNRILESMITDIYSAEALEDGFEDAIFEGCLNDSKRRLLE